MKKIFKRSLSSFLVIAMIAAMVPTASFAENFEQSEIYFEEADSVTDYPIDKLCEHHPSHEGCSFKEAVEAIPCTHEHGEECYADTVICCHTHDESCGYIPAIEGTACGHIHDENCGFVEAVPEVLCNCEVQLIHTENCSAAPAVEEIPCDCESQDVHAENCAYVPAVGEIPCDCDVQIIHAENCSYAPAEEGSPCAHVHDEVCGYSEGVPAQGICVHVCSEESGCIVNSLNCTHIHDDACGYREGVEATECDFECGICGVEYEHTSEIRLYGIEGNDELYNDYVESLFFDHKSQVYFGTFGYESLNNSFQRGIYDLLKPVVVDTANGRCASTKLSVSKSVTVDGAYSADEAFEILDEHLEVVYRALIQDCAYELYWTCYLISYSTSYRYLGSGQYSITFKTIGIPVSPNYRMYKDDYFSFNTSKATVPQRAAANARSIVSRYSDLNDYQKLLAYKNQICDLVSYNYDAVYQNNYEDVDINPWGLVYVFDNDPSTNVVCEGYAEAFQYLFEKSYFDGYVESIIVSGDAGGAHRWNVVNIEGKSYLVDVTWCDQDNGGSNNDYFMVGASSGSINYGYYIKGAKRTYEEACIHLWGNGSDSILKLASSDYVPSTSSIRAPTLKIANRPSDGKPSLSWNSVGASSYEIYRSNSSGGTYSKIGTIYGTSYVDTSAVAGTTYYYKVKAVSGGAYAFSSAVSNVCDLKMPTLTVSNNASSGKPVVSWTSVSGATAYELWGRDSVTSSYENLYTTTNTSFTHSSAKAGETYIYKVRAVHSNTAANSEFCDAQSTVCDLKMPSISVSNNASSGKPVVSWGSISGAASYDVYARSGQSSAYTKLTNTSSTSYSHSSAVAGETYIYKVRAVHSNPSANSSFSGGKGIVCDLKIPTLAVSTNAASGKPVVSWSAVSGAASYDIYARDSKTSVYTKLTNTSSTRYNHSAAVAGETYIYKVRAVHSNPSANSAFSGGMGVVCDLKMPTISISNNATTGKPTVSWSAISGAVSYDIYARSSQTSVYTKLGNTSATSFKHSGAVAGETYFYKVRAVHSKASANSAFTGGKGYICDLAMPTINVSRAENGKPMVSWDIIPGALGYEVYVRTSDNAAYTYLATAYGSSFIHSYAEKGEVYFYKVRAIHSNASANSVLSEGKGITSR